MGHSYRPGSHAKTHVRMVRYCQVKAVVIMGLSVNDVLVRLCNVKTECLVQPCLPQLIVERALFPNFATLNI
jgi:hypothetical protein